MLKYGPKHAAIVAGGTVVGWAIATGESANAWPLAVWLLAWGFGWFYSCWRHPTRPCRYCEGTGEHRGAVFTYGKGECRHCEGKRKYPRLGTRVFGLTGRASS